MDDPILDRIVNRTRPGLKVKAEIDRIIALPPAPEFSPEIHEQLSRTYVQAKPYEGNCDCPTCGNEPFRLLEDQAKGLHTFLETGRGFFSIKVGGGKTGLCMLIASIAHSLNPEGKTLYLLPASVYKQFYFQDLPWGRRHLALGVPFQGLGNCSKQKRLTLARSGRPGCYVLPYSCLSTEDTIEILREIGADLVIADEAQYLQGDSAKTKRWWAFVKQAKPRGVAMSGTLTKSSPMDYHKIIRWCLDDYSPLPIPKVIAAQWANALRSGRIPKFEELLEFRPLLKLYGEPMSQEGLRKAYRQRLHTTPGFITSGDKALGTSLEIANLSVKTTSVPGWNRLKDMIESVQSSYTHPSGDILTYGIEIHNALRELSAGFYFRRFWDESHPRVAEAKACWEAQQEYHAELREFFKSTRVPREGQDTPMAVGKWHSLHGAIDGWGRLFELWEAWKELEDDDLPERLSEPVWVCSYKIDHAVAWAKRMKTGGILWCYHEPVMQKLAQELKKAGLPVLLKGAGESWSNTDGSEKFFCVASILAHGTGKNLQHHSNQLLVQWPRPSSQAEQLIGRTHRTGQKADRLVVHTNLVLDFDFEQQAATLADTVYDHETMGGRKKLLIADYNPLPREYPPEFLRARGYA